MPWDESAYNDFFAAVAGLENPRALEVNVDSSLNRGANVLATYTGTLVLGKLHPFGNFTEEFQPPSNDWSRGLVRFRIPTPGRRWTFIPLEGIPQPSSPRPGAPGTTSPMTYFHGGTVVVALASIFNKDVANSAGWAVDGAELFALGYTDEGLEVAAKIAVRDTDGFLHRLAYQVTALGQWTPPVVVGPSPA